MAAGQPGQHRVLALGDDARAHEHSQEIQGRQAAGPLPGRNVVGHQLELVEHRGHNHSRPDTGAAPSRFNPGLCRNVASKRRLTLDNMLI